MPVLGLCLLTMLFWGMAPLFEKAALATVTPLTALAIRAFVMALAYGAMLLATGSVGELFRVDGRSLLYIVLSALFGGIIGLFIYFQALKIGDVELVIPITASYPLVTVLLAVLFLGESLTLSRLFGAALIVGGIYFLR